MRMNQEKYTKQIYSRFTVLAGCADSEIAELSLIMLCQKAIEDKDYEEAEQLWGMLQSAAHLSQNF